MYYNISRCKNVFQYIFPQTFSNDSRTTKLTVADHCIDDTIQNELKD